MISVGRFSGIGAAPWALRLTATVTAGLLWAQPVLAGAFLDGGFDALAAHRENATVAGLGVAATALVAVVWRVLRGPLWPVLAGVGLFALVGVQIAIGFSRLIWLHVPLGVLLVAGGTALAAAAWRAVGEAR